MIKQYIILSLILVSALSIFSLNRRVLASECRSELKGQCVRLAAVTPVEIRGLEFLNIPPGADLGDTIARIYTFGMGLVGLSALVMFIIGGVLYMTAGDSQERAGRGRKFIGNAIFGLLLALLSYLILFTVNPELVKPLNLKFNQISITDDDLKNLPKPQDFVGSDQDWERIKGGGVQASTGVRCKDGTVKLGAVPGRTKVSCEGVRAQIKKDPSLKEKNAGISVLGGKLEPYEEWKNRCWNVACTDINE